LRSVLLLYLSGFTPSRIAESLGLDRTRIDRLIHSGLEILRSRLMRDR
jgi:DNA-directed RNA polymerase specialized sigma24 family protein